MSIDCQRISDKHQSLYKKSQKMFDEVSFVEKLRNVNIEIQIVVGKKENVM